MGTDESKMLDGEFCCHEPFSLLRSINHLFSLYYDPWMICSISIFNYLKRWSNFYVNEYLSIMLNPFSLFLICNDCTKIDLFSEYACCDPAVQLVYNAYFISLYLFFGGVMYEEFSQHSYAHFFPIRCKNMNTVSLSFICHK